MLEALQMNFPGADLEIKIVLSILFRGGRGERSFLLRLNYAVCVPEGAERRQASSTP